MQHWGGEMQFVDLRFRGYNGRASNTTNMKRTLTPRTLLLSLFAILALGSLSSCVPLAAGAAGGYVAHDQGYRITNPIRKVD